MQRKVTALIVVLLFVMVFPHVAFAELREIFSSSECTILTNGEGDFEVYANNMCIPLTGTPTQDAGVYEMICGDATRKIVSEAIEIAKELADELGFPFPTKFLLDAGEAMYNALCDQFQ